ncbi:MAG TPA: hypothetical protein V6C95_15715, partial [Coleofasciculaceae cyanobacterium]
VACQNSPETSQTLLNPNRKSEAIVAGRLSEVAPPPVIQQLSQSLDGYQPQVTILSPRADEILQDTTISVKLQVEDLPIFKDTNLGLGPHLHVILDNQPYQADYDLDQPLVFEDLAPGTHTLRVFASRPWHESFKNEGAYAQTTFHIFTKTSDNTPDPASPLLTYSRPTGSYGAEPIMLDFYLTNAPLHVIAQENPDDNIADWRIRVTVNGENFILDRWQPIYLKGFKRGKNWVRLEFLDEQGNPVKNAFNDTVRLITYEPKGKDTLSRLVRGELSADAARSIVGSSYKFKPLPVETPTPTPSPVETPISEPEPTPAVEEIPPPELVQPEEEVTPPAELTTPEPTESPTPEVKQTEKQKSGNIFSRFRRPSEAPSPSPQLPEEPVVIPEEAEQVPELKTPVPEEIEQASEPETSVTPNDSSREKAVQTEPLPSEKPKSGGIFNRFSSGILNRFRRPDEAPSPSPQLPEEFVVPDEIEQPPEPESSVTPSESQTSVEEAPPAAEPETPDEETAPVTEPMPIRPIQPQKTPGNGFFNRFRSAPSDSVTPPESGLSPTLPEIIETPPSELSEPEAVPQPEPLNESAPAVEELSSPESLAVEKPKLDLKKIFLPPSTPNPSPTIIQAPADTQLEVPSRYLKKSEPDVTTEIPESSEAPVIDSETTVVP